MKKNINKLITNRPFLLSLMASVYVPYIIYISLVLELSLLFFVFAFLPFVFFEILLRITLRIVYGKHYKYALFNYFLTNHSIYGNSLRKSIDSTKINFPIFDKFVFKKDIHPGFNLNENKKGRVKYTVNSLGFRGKEFTKEKKGDVIRIFCSGGSTTACNSIDDDETWTQELERQLLSSGYNVEVINAGLQGGSSYQELLRFNNEIVKYNPDVVLLHQGWNEEFAYSSQNLGKWWTPNTVRNIIETRYLYSGRHSLLSSSRSILFFYLMQVYFKDIIFNKNMKFSNWERWNCLKQKKYLISWFDNLVSFAEGSQRKKIKLYTINCPGLCDFDDSIDERKIYIDNTRLTELYADYQAVSKRQIGRTFERTSHVIPCIDAEKEMVGIRGKERLELFIDEIHMSPKGNTLLGKIIAKKLLEDKNFKELLDRKSNIDFDEKKVFNIREGVGENYDYVNRFIDTKIEDLKRSYVKGDKLDLPVERYTTF
ncbi:MAG: SGNH/GDSL hydrolase family protein [Candidatus Pacebacteria bacterium]|jgi:hypothetical protein|nr:SGNH/GDSL hydrolase family protein [Candidatus Paceibacterota bacterium]